MNILLIGDDCRDVYQYGNIDRLSPEAPVPIFKLNYEQVKPGMAGNVYENLIKLNCKVNYIYDKTSIKTRLIDVKSGQHIVRIDNDIISEPINCKENLNLYDAIVISDYNKGTVDSNLILSLIEKYKGPIFIDTKKTDLAQFDKCYVKINAIEYANLKTFPTNLIVTKGKDGAWYKDKIYPTVDIEVVDSCGAGDTFLAALVYGYLLNKDIEKGIVFANRASGVTIQHRGVYAPNLDEINLIKL